MIMNWQTPAALTVVALTAIIFLLRLRRGKKSCGTSSCACPKK
ncbi:MAG: hypothetical protein ACJAQT_001092 [Akkermansiaceae bacterium]|jgi:hypothetical protein